MRIIKFRAWDKLNKKMIDDADFIHINLNGEVLIGDDWCGACDQNKYSTEEKGKENYLLMQYTGLKDKNGKEIYEGDIVKIKYARCWEEDIYPIGPVYRESINDKTLKVEYRDEFGMFNIAEFCYGNCCMIECEVIGNIYENPELLEIK